MGCGAIKTKEQSKNDVKAKIMEIETEIDRITGNAVHRRENKSAELVKLPLRKRMRILNEIPLFTVEERDRLNELRVQLGGQNDILERFFTQTLKAKPNEDEPLY